MGRLVTRLLTFGLTARRRAGLPPAFLALATIVGSLLLLAIAAPASEAQADQQVIELLDGEGRYLELEESLLDDAVDRANDQGIAVILLDQRGDEDAAEVLAEDYVVGLEEAGSRYRTVLVVTLDAYAAFSADYSSGPMNTALNASFESFSNSTVAEGVDIFTSSLTGSATDDTQTESGGGIGFGTILLAVAAIGGAFLLARRWSGGRKEKRQAAIDLEEDRVEIKEQLKNNADRVIQLGDRVIANGNAPLIETYEQASRSYQDVSQRIDEATTAVEIDELDDRIDHAEWQFESIEAQLEGRPVPPSPADREAAESARADAPRPPQDTPPPPNDRSVVTSPRTGRSYPTSRGRARRTSGGGLGGALGGILGNIILGGGLGGMTRSRRTQRRSGGTGLGFPGLGGGGSRRSTGSPGSGIGLGGGGSVIRPGQPRSRTTGRRSGSGGSRRRSNTSRSKTRARSRSRTTRRSTRGSGGGRRR